MTACSEDACDRSTVARGLCDLHYRRLTRYGSTADRPRPTRGVCVIESCSGETEARGWCHVHYTRWVRTGSTDDPVKPSGCSVAECAAPHMAQGMCGKHYWRWRNHGDPTYVAPAPGWRGDNVGYFGVHHRLRSQRGHASTHPCAACGEPAAEWAYDHTDPDERHAGEGGLLPYSLDPDRYLPLCKTCHTAFDRTHLLAQTA